MNIYDTGKHESHEDQSGNECRTHSSKPELARTHQGQMGRHLDEQWSAQEETGFANISAKAPLRLVKVVISMVVTAQWGSVAWFGDQSCDNIATVVIMYTDISRAHFREEETYVELQHEAWTSGAPGYGTTESVTVRHSIMLQ